MKTGKDVIPFAEKFKGNKYVFGVVVPKKDPTYDGPFDCAEFTTYCNYQVFGIMYGARGGDAYTGFYAEDVAKLGVAISVEEAARTPGALLLRRPQNGAIGHVVFSKGDGTTIEAYDTRHGVINSVVTGRRWSTGIKIPGVVYMANPVKVITVPPAVVYRLKKPFMQAPFVKQIQEALGKTPHGYTNPKTWDGIYGPSTQASVVAFQKSQGLVADGEVMPGGQTAKALGIK